MTWAVRVRAEVHGRVGAECADGYAVAIQTGDGWTYYERGGYGTHATIDDNVPEGSTRKMRACAEFTTTDLLSGSWVTVTA